VCISRPSQYLFFNFLRTINHLHFTLFSYSPHLIIVLYFSLFAISFISMEQMLILNNYYCLSYICVILDDEVVRPWCSQSVSIGNNTHLLTERTWISRPSQYLFFNFLCTINHLHFTLFSYSPKDMTTNKPKWNKYSLSRENDSKYFWFFGYFIVARR